MQDTDLSWVFDLPTDFATVLDTDKLRTLPKWAALLLHNLTWFQWTFILHITVCFHSTQLLLLLLHTHCFARYKMLSDGSQTMLAHRFSPMGIAQAGVLFFRPCIAVGQHMMRLAQVRAIWSCLAVAAGFWVASQLIRRVIEAMLSHE
jgi:hypothetical protein